VVKNNKKQALKKKKKTQKPSFVGTVQALLLNPKTRILILIGLMIVFFLSVGFRMYFANSSFFQPKQSAKQTDNAHNNINVRPSEEVVSNQKPLQSDIINKSPTNTPTSLPIPPTSTPAPPTSSPTPTAPLNVSPGEVQQICNALGDGACDAGNFTATTKNGAVSVIYSRFGSGCATFNLPSGMVVAWYNDSSVPGGPPHWTHIENGPETTVSLCSAQFYTSLDIPSHNRYSYLVVSQTIKSVIILPLQLDLTG
jgi:hypothetical protein